MFKTRRKRSAKWPANRPEQDSDFYFYTCGRPGDCSRIIELVKARIPRRFGLDPIRDIQVVCPMNRGGVGARSLNIEHRAPGRVQSRR
jgi:exodeoxyribonuclease V alpha subunit